MWEHEIQGCLHGNSEAFDARRQQRYQCQTFLSFW